MKQILICLGLIVGMLGSTPSLAQSADQSTKSDLTMLKLRQIDLLNMIVPLALTKDQINTILPAIERARQKVRQIEKDEATTLEKLDSRVSDAIKKSIETSVAPPKELLDELAHATQAMSDARGAAVNENTANVLKVFNATCNAGQKKAAANSFAPTYIDPNAKPDTLTDEQKTTFFVRDILLDPQAYDILLQLAKHAS